MYAYEESVAHYARAVALLAAGEEPSRRCELLLALGEARSRAGDADQAARSFLEAAALAEETGLAELFARAALGYGGGEVGFSVADRADERLIGLLRRALDMLPPEDGVLRVRVLARLAVELYYLDNPREPDEISRQAVEMAERIGETSIRLLAVHSRQIAIMSPDGLEERLAAGEEIVRLARAGQDREMEFHGHHLRLTARLQLAELERVDAEIRACTRLARDLRQPRYDWQVTAFRAMRALLEGRFAEGERLGKAALSIGQRGLGEMAAGVFGVHVFLARWADDRLEEIEEGGRAFADTYRNSAWPAAFAMLLAEVDNRDETRARFDALKPDGFRAVRQNSNWLAAMACLSVVCLYLEDEEAGATLYELFEPYADQFVPILAGTSCLGSAHGWVGMTAHAAGRLDEAIEHYEQGIAAGERVGARVVAPRLRYLLAQALKRRGGPGDAGQAIREAEAGLELAREMGMVGEARRLLALRQYEAALAGVDVHTSIDLVARSVEEARPDLAPAAAPDGTVTIMFSDIEGSTVLTEQLGDSGWFALLRLHNDIIREQLARHGGFEVRQLGDGFMIAFSSARMAIWCAVGIQRDLQAHRLRRPRDEISVRIGLHTGETIRSNQDFFGTNVNMAARVADQAKGDEIVVSAVLRDLVASGREFSFENEREVELKGLTGRHRIFSVPWEPGETVDKAP